MQTFRRRLIEIETQFTRTDKSSSERGLSFATSAPELRSPTLPRFPGAPLPHLHRDWAHHVFPLQTARSTQHATQKRTT